MKCIFVATLALLFARPALAHAEEIIETASWKKQSAEDITPSFDEQSHSELALYGMENQDNFPEEEPATDEVEINQEDW
jgi:hypothetical protein